MLIYEYVSKILPELNANFTDYNNTMKSKVLNIICQALDLPSEVRYLELSYSQIDNPLIKKVLFMLGLSDDNYVKYYLLDLVTSGDFIVGLIKSICQLSLKNIMYIINFDLQSFTSVKSLPTIFITYKASMTNLGIDSIIYDQPINGMMELDDAYSLLADLFIILHPDKCIDFFTTRLFQQINVIKCSDKRSISIRECLMPIQSSPATQLLVSGDACSHQFNNVIIATILCKVAEPRLVCNENNSILSLDYFCSRLGITLQQLRENC